MRFLIWPDNSIRKAGCRINFGITGKPINFEKTRVFRSCQKHTDVFSLFCLNDSYDYLMFNMSYPTVADIEIPMQDEIEHIINGVRTLGTNTPKTGSVYIHLNHLQENVKSIAAFQFLADFGSDSKLAKSYSNLPSMYKED